MFYPWRIRIEPPEKILSKEDRKGEISDYIHDEESEMLAHSHADPNFKGSKRYQCILIFFFAKPIYLNQICGSLYYETKD